MPIINADTNPHPAPRNPHDQPTAPESRRLEFKSQLPAAEALAKTIIAFANDAGGSLYIGVDDKTREVTGIPDEELMPTEEKISNIIHDTIYPTVIPDITFQGEGDKNIICVKVYRGSNPPYYIKSKGKREGTYIRVGSTNRQADEELIAELERQKHHVSYDSELVHDKPFSLDSMQTLSSFFKEKTGEEFTLEAAKKLNLCREYQGTLYPTIGGVLFSDNDLRETRFPYAKVECALFKGNDSSHFLDQKTIDQPLCLQPEETMAFVKRHINESGTIEGVYTVRRWDFPLNAIREVIRNAVVHRDYSLRGKDIKVAVYKDMVEITSPGRLLPSIDYGTSATRQSDIRNKVIAPLFRKTGLIDQWGNGLKIISDAMRQYPEIEFRWKEAGLAFQVQFAKREPGGTYAETETASNTAKEPHTTNESVITRHGTSTEGSWQIFNKKIGE